MIQRLAAIFSIEFRVLSRNRWLAVAIFVMIAFSLLIAFAGSAPIGTVAAERLTVTAASLGTLMVYVVPLIALLISYDSVSGEASRGTLALLLVYPATRTEILAGKWIAQFLVIVVAIVAGTGSAALLVAMTELPSSEALSHLIRLVWSACLLGAVFLSIGSCISASTREPGAAAAVAIATWILVVVMLDVALLAALVNDDGGAFTQQVFPGS